MSSQWLRGKMSLVEPGPIILLELQDYYGPATNLYVRVRLGMTGLLQVSGHSDTSYEHHVILDEWHILNWSLWYDTIIFVQTAWFVIVGKSVV